MRLPQYVERKNRYKIDTVIPEIYPQTQKDYSKRCRERKRGAMPCERRGKEAEGGKSKVNIRGGRKAGSAGNVSACSSAQWTDLFWLWVTDDPKPQKHGELSHHILPRYPLKIVFSSLYIKRRTLVVMWDIIGAQQADGRHDIPWLVFSVSLPCYILAEII